nr:amino acid adenylation domain-containing protein [Bacteroidota bacterium]
GSTGKPKGVMVSHKNVVSLVKGVGYVSLTREDILLSTGSSSFDATTLEYWGMLLNGGQLVLCPENKLLDNKLLKEEINNRRVNRMWFTSGWFNQLVEADITIFEKLSTVLVGGEKLSPTHIEKLRQTYPTVEIINGYGPTENTTFSLTYRIKEISIKKPIPIGRPLNNRSAFILDEYYNIVPIGVNGEICLSGDGLSRGYLNRPELTLEKFIKSPLSDTMIYKTGDIGHWLPDGNIEYVGRKDEQVKIRGFRIELGEIESVLQECEEVKHAVVMARANQEGIKRLVGYIVPNGEYDKSTILAYLKNKLPEYMVPAIMVEMETLPLNPNGKVDRKALPDPELVDLTNKEFVAPRNHGETILANIWQELLGLDEIGIHDNFFELGGDSLLAIRVVSAIRKELEVEMPISNLFEYQTIATLAKQIETQSGAIVLPPIQPVKRPAHIPLSFSQERLWFIDRLEGSLQYHIPAVMRLKGHLNIKALEHALSSIINRHEVLRTVFLEQDGDAYQLVKDIANWELPLIDGTSYNNDKQGRGNLIQQFIGSAFDLSKDNMLRAYLVVLNPMEHILVVTLHHIASDGWSRSILVKEVTELYTAFEENRAADLAPIPIQYADFAIWQRSYLQGGILDKKLGYWKEKLQGTEPLQMPLDFPRPAIQTIRGGSVSFTFDKDLSVALQNLSQQNGSTLFMVLLASLKVLLYRYTSHGDICVGTGSAGRQQKEVEGLIGFFVNTLALRDEIKADDNFIELLQKVRKTTLEAYENQEVPFEKIVDTLVKKRDRSRNPIFQVMFVLQNTPEIPTLKLGELEFAREGYEHATAQFDLSFSMIETTQGLNGSLEYNADLYKRATVERLLMHFHQLVVSIVSEPQKKICEFSFMSKDEANHILFNLNDNDTAYPSDKTIIAIFEEQVAAYPESTAVIFADEKLTYYQLNNRANQLARHLQAKGVKKETLVAISIERSLEMMVGILGILKGGGAYVPIDAEYPADRITFMLEDTGAGIIITSNKVIGKLPGSNKIEIISLDGNWPEIAKQSTADLQVTVKPGSLAYIIYTSGSTGKPKGVMVTQQNVVSLVKGIDYVSLSKEDVLLSTGSSSFDATTIEYWGMLLNGGQLVICEEQTLLNSDLLKAEVDKRKVTKMWFTSSWFNELVENHISVFERLNTVMVGGEKLSEHHIEKLRQTYSQIEIINGYGPTENTTFSLTYKITDFLIRSAIPIGRPLNNRKAYILDEHQQLVPVGVPGEICLGGDGLSRGYLNRPNLTAEKFVKHPFSKHGDEKIYKTGDIGRWLPDGNIEYLGRIDDQVKIRGYRIELGEIEAVLQQSNLISQAVVLPWLNKEQNKILVGYIVPSGNYDKNILIAYLREKLPDYMIPSIWVELDRFSLTSNGKVDKRALPEPDLSYVLSDQYVSPDTEMELKLIVIWKDILRIERIGIHDNFFELGGHSLLAMRLISAVRKELQAEVMVRELFMYPTIAELARYIQKENNKSLLPSIEVHNRPEHIPLSFSQERLWFIDQLEGSVQYNSPAALRLKGRLNVEALIYALQNIIKRHEVLRTVFYESDGKPYQSVIDIDDWHLSFVNGSEYEKDPTGLKRFIENLIAAPFDLSKDYMLRADLIKLEETEHVLVVTMHHIASDGWSLPIIVQEVVELYNSFQEKRPTLLAQLPMQYVDYSIWQRKYLQGEVMQKRVSYWKTKLAGVSPLEMPTDYARPSVRNTVGSSMNFMIEKELSDELNELSKEQGTTLFMTLLATYMIMLSRYTGQQDICVGTSIANRPHQQLEGLIGFFVNTLALRNEMIETFTFIEFLQLVKMTTLEAYENQDVPFEKVVEEVVKERDPGRSPLFQVMLVLLNTPESEKLGFNQIGLSNEAFEIKISKFDFTFHISQSFRGLPFTVVYNTDLFREDTIIRMAGHFKQLLNSIIKEPHQNIDLLQMLTNAEEQQLLVEFN